MTYKEQIDVAHGRAKDLPVGKTAQLLVPVLFPMSGVTTCNSLTHPKLTLMHLLTEDDITLVAA